MLTPAKRISRVISGYENRNDEVVFFSEAGSLRIQAYMENTLRVSFDETGLFSKEQDVFLEKKPEGHLLIDVSKDGWLVTAGEVAVNVSKNGMNLSFFREGKCILRQPKENPIELIPFDSYRLKAGGKLETEDVKTADGVKKHVVSAEREYYGKFFRTRIRFDFDKCERLFGLGQFEEGIWNLKGKTIYLHQANKQISIPVLVSDRGYGLMFTTGSPSVFSDGAYGSYFYSTADFYADFFFTAPGKYEEIISNIRKLTGKAAMLPKWAFRYVQSRERYENEKEIIDTATEFDRQGIDLGCIVLDWMSWEDGMWGQKSFDPKRFPDVEGMISKLHSMDTAFMVSIWPSVDEKSENYKEFDKEGLLLPGTNVYNAFLEEGRRMYWNQTERGLASRGVESFWCDSSEPLTPEWEKAIEPVPEQKFSEFCERASDSMYIEKGNAYGHFHAMGIYEGQRKDHPQRRVMNLTRSCYLGTQKYGVTVWSGDIAASFDTLKKQISAGLSVAVCGIAYWTFDIGAFFVKPGREWFWNGKYENPSDNPGYKELYTRWLQLGSFLSMFRSHGTDLYREPWNIDSKDGIFYKAIIESIDFRKRHLPYFYSVAANVWKNDGMFIRPLFMEFPDDENVRDITTQFMCGPSFMVCPVLSHMYFDEEGNPLEDTHKKLYVIFPGDCGFTDYYTGMHYEGGTAAYVDAPLDRIPLFVKDGGIIPVYEDGKLCIKVYKGKDGTFDLYNDAGDGYGYENKEYCITGFKYDDKSGRLNATTEGDMSFFEEYEIKIQQ